MPLALRWRHRPVRLDDHAGSFARLAAAIARADGSLGAIDLIRVERSTNVRDVAVLAADPDHLKTIVEAMSAVDEHAEVIAGRPTWLFSSGPIGSPPHSAASDPFDATEIADVTHAREHHLFGGWLDKENLRATEKALTRALRVAGGDYREWDAVAAWATAIARAITSEVAV